MNTDAIERLMRAWQWKNDLKTIIKVQKQGAKALLRFRWVEFNLHKLGCDNLFMTTLENLRMSLVKRKEKECRFYLQLLVKKALGKTKLFLGDLPTKKSCWRETVIFVTALNEGWISWLSIVDSERNGE